MAQHKRDEDKKRRRKKRLEKRARAAGARSESALDELGQIIGTLQRHLAVPEPERWPGGCDPSLARPDLVKLDLAQFATERSPGREKAKQFEDGCCKGLVHLLSAVDHWSWEEFIYHGLPGDSWHPIDAYLAQAAARYPPAAAAQLRRWKDARLGLYEIGEVTDDTVALREWDGVRRVPAGPPLWAITLNIGGVDILRGQEGMILLTYLAPWLPEANLYCGMGYSRTADKGSCDYFLLHLGLRHPDVVGRPLPWNEDRGAEERYMSEWLSREWLGWLEERLVFPFPALIGVPPRSEPRLLEVPGLLPSTAEDARLYGIYFDVPWEEMKMSLAAGGTVVIPLDVTSRNRLALAEYHAFRKRVGKPPGVQGKPAYLEM
ncbi:MAG TPA: hypothetical protein VKA46_06970 [Gemmataceae bacterium]|nr:hypothetical protein [Gemmataceae bacterium]